VASPRVREIFRTFVPRDTALDRWLTQVRYPATVDRHWFRVAMYDALQARLAELDPATLDAVEISGDAHAHHGWRTFTRLDYPDFDICAPTSHDQYDVVLCDNVLEHVTDPFSATRTLFDLCRPGGLCFVAAPFLYRVHYSPGDYWRFTRDGLERLLACAGFSEIETDSWGNRWCVGAHLFHDWLGTWRGIPMRNEAALPIMVWAFGRRPALSV
jgi:SAM-dependent methyltransferase